MNAGRELDALVAERVMGWLPWDWTAGDWDGPSGATYFATNESGAAMYDHSALAVYEDGSDEPTLWFSPSKDIAAAWIVVGHLGRTGRTVIQTNYPDGTAVVMVTMKGRTEVTAQGDGAPHAICLAALRAVGVEL